LTNGYDDAQNAWRAKHTMIIPYHLGDFFGCIEQAYEHLCDNAQKIRAAWKKTGFYLFQYAGQRSLYCTPGLAPIFIFISDRCMHGVCTTTRTNAVYMCARGIGTFPLDPVGAVAETLNLISSTTASLVACLTRRSCRASERTTASFDLVTVPQV
jgi:hypothetical protein